MLVFVTWETSNWLNAQAFRIDERGDAPYSHRPIYIQRIRIEPYCVVRCVRMLFAHHTFVLSSLQILLLLLLLPVTILHSLFCSLALIYSFLMAVLSKIGITLPEPKLYQEQNDSARHAPPYTCHILLFRNFGTTCALRVVRFASFQYTKTSDSTILFYHRCRYNNT